MKSLLLFPCMVTARIYLRTTFVLPCFNGCKFVEKIAALIHLLPITCYHRENMQTANAQPSSCKSSAVTAVLIVM